MTAPKVTITRKSELTYRRITALNVEDICELSETLSDVQREMVADNGTSIAEGFCSDVAWFRGVYAGETPIGFVMTHTGSDWDDGIECHGEFLWRLMIASPFQSFGFGRRVVQEIARRVVASGRTRLYTSYSLGFGSPEGFYRRLGFEPTGDSFGEEPEALLDLSMSNILGEDFTNSTSGGLLRD
ncbi:GNAT family N-acetyltransferase [Rhodococcus qingshengii]|jgi:diamine N-acetyltransferase|uniref:GNAT family N-acetyltransferase n=2 Tax=cellular organisms TaxID=131567 RepID=UPI0012FD5554|nr:GNAT family N-acetyltransferase [uncultured Rhodococcus sp.]